MYDVIIIGGGPAGLAAGIYAGRYKLKTMVMTKLLGGAMTEAHLIENYPGLEHISGMELADKMRSQAEHLGVEIVEDEVERLEKTNQGFLVNKKFESKYLILALGTERKKLNLPKERDFIGKGVSYCATCDAPLFRDKVAAVIGGRDSALMAADLLTRYAKRVYIIYRGQALLGQPVSVEKLTANPKVEIILNSNVTELLGDGMLNTIRLDNGQEIHLDGLFVEIGSTPAVVLAKEIGAKLDDDDCITVDANMQTSIHKMYAAGDVTSHNAKWRQIVIACAEGALASRSIYEEMRKTKTNEYT